MKNVLGTVGLRRCTLYAIALAIVALSFFSGGETQYDNWRAVPTIVAPTLVPILFFVLALDTMMSFIFRADAKAVAAARYNAVVTINLVVVCLLVLSWSPFFVALFSI
ncbi:MAG: hypothetical protein QF609_11530 [Gammaproteobacteria bacterium]|jgi:Zn-dependent protease with chaperone function|nr:hypothetical protein [Gammaproteobacteria bacterium]